MIAGEYLHFRCAWHAVEGYFEPTQGKPPRSGFERKCSVVGCSNRGFAFWYRGAKWAELPVPNSTRGLG